MRYCCLFYLAVLSVLAYSDTFTKHHKTADKKNLYVAIEKEFIEPNDMEEFVVKRFDHDYSGSDMTPVIHQTNDVLASLMQGFADVGITHRQWSDKEVSLLKEKYQKLPMQLIIAADAYAVVVNQDNPIESVSKQELLGLFDQSNQTTCTDSQTILWNNLPNFPSDRDEKIEVEPYAYGTNKRLWLAFKSLLCDTLTTQRVATQADAFEVVKRERGAFTFQAYLSDNNGMRLLPLRDDQGVIKPLRIDTIFSGEYPLSKRYYLHIAPNVLEEENVQLYVNYLLSDASQTYLTSKGLVALPKAILQRNQVILQQRSPQYPGGYQ